MVFVTHTVATLAVIFFQPQVAAHTVSLMSATVPLYIVIFGGYFGKAGLENYNKIKYWEPDATETVRTNRVSINVESPTVCETSDEVG